MISLRRSWQTFECGRSNHGAHLNGIAFLCSRLVERSHPLSQSQTFLVTALTWLVSPFINKSPLLINISRFDLLRGFSGAEKLAFPPNLHKFIATSAGPTLTSLVGCPVEVFTAISDTLLEGKKYYVNEIEKGDFQTYLDPILLGLQVWDPATGLYPSEDSEWIHLAEAYRNMAILRILRLPDAFEIPCTDQVIRTSVEAILDASTRVPRRSQYFKRLLFPLFIAAAETASPHQQQYVTMCIEHISNMSGIIYHSINELLEKTWQDRKTSDGSRNVPWHEYVRVPLDLGGPHRLTAFRRVRHIWLRDSTTTCSFNVPSGHVITRLYGICRFTNFNIRQSCQVSLRRTGNCAII